MAEWLTERLTEWLTQCLTELLIEWFNAIEVSVSSARSLSKFLGLRVSGQGKLDNRRAQN